MARNTNDSLHLMKIKIKKKKVKFIGELTVVLWICFVCLVKQEKYQKSNFYLCWFCHSGYCIVTSTWFFTCWSSAL